MDQFLDQLLQTLRGMWLHRFWGLAVAWLVALVGVPIALLMPAQYEASARVFLDTESVLKPLMEGLAVQPNSEQQVKILADTLMSRPNVEKLVSLSGLDQTQAAQRDRNGLIEKLTKKVKLSGSARDNLFSLSYRDSDPTQAKRVIESLLSLFVESGLSHKRRDTDKALAFLDVQIKEYEAVLSKAEERLKEFKLQNLDHLASAQDSVAAMMTLDTDIEKARTELRVAEQRRDALRAQLSSEDPVFLSDRGVERAPGTPVQAGVDPVADLDARADALRRNLDELLRKYTDEHPDVVGTRRILADLQKQRELLVQERQRGGPTAPTSTRREPNLVYQQLKVALAQAEANVAELRTRLSQLESRYNRIRSAAKLRPEFEKELAQLNRDYEIQKSNFEKLVQRREQAKLTGELGESGSVDFRVIDPPRVSPKPVAPNRLMLVLGAVVLSVGGGLGASLAANQALATISSVRDLRAFTQLGVLGAISRRLTPAEDRRRRRTNYAFAGGVTGLCTLFGVALGFLLIAMRAG
jgi:polysaccharide chain length determinant protein (PEP-CTERM system associated)